MSQPIKTSPPGAHAWCSDCPWTDITSQSEANAALHSGALQHLVHYWEPDPMTVADAEQDARDHQFDLGSDQ